MQASYGKRQPLIDIFLETNSQINLSAIRTPEGVYHKHILDALEIGKIFDFQSGETMLDVGTGGGFPLLPLAMEYPQLECFGLDATQKKCRAVQTMADSLGLKNLSTIRGRAEDHKGSYDLVTSRAVGFAEKLFPWTAKFVKSGGYLVRRKMRSKEEDAYILDHHKHYKLTLEAKHEYHLEHDEMKRILYVFQKK